MKAREVSKIALKAGEILLENGAETYRIEETVTLICSFYGYSAECVSLPYGIFLNVGDNEIKKTIMRKVLGQQFDLHKIELVNEFSRSLKNNIIPFDEAMCKLKEIKGAPNFSLLLQAIAASVTGLVYTIIFNGTVFDSIAAAIITLAVFIMMSKTKKVGAFQYIVYFISGFLIGILSILASIIFDTLNSHYINTGAIMILLPGIILTNGLKDFVYGDFSSGTAKVFQAVLIIIAVALGVGLALSVGGMGVD